jgi:hypothetical protein
MGQNFVILFAVLPHFVQAHSSFRHWFGGAPITSLHNPIRMARSPQ